MMWLFAQDLPDAKLLQGDVQEILVWVVLSLILLYVVTVGYFIRRQGFQEEKYDALVDRQNRQISRSNRAMEAVANLPPPPNEEESG